MEITTKEELAKLLKKIYDRAKGRVVPTIQLFGINYTCLIPKLETSSKELFKLARINNNLYTGLDKGIKLSHYVDVKDAGMSLLSDTEAVES